MRGGVRKLILHCGLPKTGTTALQTWMHRFRSELSEAGLRYPEPFDEFEPKQGFVVRELKEPGPNPTIDRVLGTTEEQTVLLSNEGLTNHLYDFSSGALAEFRRSTRQLDVTVIFVVREFEPWLRSYHRQCVLNPNNGASELWGTAETAEGIRDHPRILALANHGTLEERMAEAFGARRVIRLDFEAGAWFPRFLRHVGIQRRAAEDLPRVNRSVPAWAIEILRQVNGLTEDGLQRLAWRQALQRHLATESVQLVAAAAAATESVDPGLLEQIEPICGWSLAETDRYRAFRDDLVEQLVHDRPSAGAGRRA